MQPRDFRILQRRNSPRWTARFWSSTRQRLVDVTTPFRVDDPQGYRRAVGYARALVERENPDRSPCAEECWDVWVLPFLEARYGNSAKTLRRYRGAWEQWRAFLELRELRIPRALTYQQVLEFVSWRSSQVKRLSGKRVSKNTALCDVRVMAVVMREAIRRSFAETNHCEKLGITKDPSRQKPEMTDGEIARIRAALKSRPEWMTISFEIALHQGCRLSETSLPLSQVDLMRDTITFHAKGRGGGQKHVFTTQLHPGLRPLLSRISSEGREQSCVLPTMAAKQWHSFFREIGLSHLCFHCTRVTVITRMARNGVPIAQAMRFVGHASETIHRIYQRLAAPDCAIAINALRFGGSETPRTPDAALAIRESVAA